MLSLLITCFSDSVDIGVDEAAKVVHAEIMARAIETTQSALTAFSKRCNEASSILRPVFDSPVVVEPESQIEYLLRMSREVEHSQVASSTAPFLF